MHNELSETQLNSLKQALILDKEQLQAQIQHSFDLLHDQKNSELSSFDNHQADYATELDDRTKEFALHDQLMTALEETESAIARIESASYGHCQTCQQLIAIDRLQAQPAAQFCLEHQPTDEQPIMTIATNYFSEVNNDDLDATYFDGEDTNQVLYSYGTSSLSQYQNYNYEFAEEFEDATQCGVELLEDFIATDITGKNVFVLRNSAYKSYIDDVDKQFDQT